MQVECSRSFFTGNEHAFSNGVDRVCLQKKKHPWQAYNRGLHTTSFVYNIARIDHIFLEYFIPYGFTDGIFTAYIHVCLYSIYQLLASCLVEKTFRSARH